MFMIRLRCVFVFYLIKFCCLIIENEQQLLLSQKSIKNYKKIIFLQENFNVNQCLIFVFSLLKTVFNYENILKV